MKKRLTLLHLFLKKFMENGLFWRNLTFQCLEFVFQTFAHAHLGGIINAITGGDYLSGFISGGIGSIGGSIAGGFLKDVTNPYLVARGISLSGAFSGAVASVVAGGNFWDGFRNGLISAGLNHAAHRIIKIDPLKKHKKDAISLKEWNEIYKDKSWKEIATEAGWKHGQPLGPKHRYVINPHSGNVMDMRHVVVVGYGYGENIGDLVEHIQNAMEQKGSAYDPHSLIDNTSFKIKGSIRNVANFYQRNERTGGKYGWWGSNPYWGSPIQATYNLYQQNFTGINSVNHLNIIRYSLANSNYKF